MEYVLTVVDKAGRRVHLSSDRWKHIALRHPELASNLEQIELALTHPNFLVAVPEKQKANYYLYDKTLKRHLLVAVRYKNNHGYVTTAFHVRKIVRR